MKMEFFSTSFEHIHKLRGFPCRQSPMEYTSGIERIAVCCPSFRPILLLLLCFHVHIAGFLIPIKFIHIRGLWKTFLEAFAFEHHGSERWASAHLACGLVYSGKGMRNSIEIILLWGYERLSWQLFPTDREVPLLPVHLPIDILPILPALLSLSRNPPSPAFVVF